MLTVFSFIDSVFSRKVFNSGQRESNLSNSISWALLIAKFMLSKRSEIFCSIFYLRHFIVMALTYRFVFHSGLYLIRCDLQAEFYVLHMNF